MTARGTLILVVGPSGAGKDSIIAGAAERFRDDGRIIFPRRIITRPGGTGGEGHVSVSADAFARLRGAGGFLLHWHAHGCDYGLPIELTSSLAAGHAVVANVSRTVVTEARRRFAPVAAVAVSAAPETLATRLRGRGREASADIESRLRRTAAISPESADFTIDNDGALEVAIEQFVALLRAILDQPRNS